MTSKSRRIPNVNGAARGPLKQVARVDSSKGLVSDAVKHSPSAQRDATRAMLDAIKQFTEDASKYQLALDAKQSDIVLGCIASLLDEVKGSSTSNELKKMKQKILDEVSGLSLSSALKSFLENQVASLFDDDAKKEDIDELKVWMQENFGASSQAKPAESSAPESESSGEPAGEAEDQEKGDYVDSTPAENFFTLQEYIQSQFDTLNENLKSIPGQSGILKSIGRMFSNGFMSVVGKVTSIGKVMAKGFGKVLSTAGHVTKFIAKGPFALIGGIAKGVSALGRGLKGIASGIGGMFKSFGTGIGKKLGGIASGIGNFGKKLGTALFFSPFKKMGKFISSLNPFNRKSAKEKKAEKKRDSIFDSLDKLVKRLKKFANNTKAAVLSFIDSIIIPTAKIIAKGLSILLKPVMSFILGAIWGSGIGVLIVGIGLGIFLISLAVKKLVDYVVDDLGPIIKHWMETLTPETVNSLVKSATNFMNTFSAVVAGLFAPLIAFGTLIMSAIEPIGDFVKRLLSSVVDHLMPIIDKILDVVEKTIVRILEAMQPVIDKIIDIVGGAILTILEAIEPIVKEMKPLLMVVSKIVCGIIRLTVLAIKAAISGITKWWDAVQKEGGLWPWFKNRMSALWKSLVSIGKALKEWYEKSSLKKWIDKIANAIKKVLGILNIGEKAKKAVTAVVDTGKRVADKAMNFIGLGKGGFEQGSSFGKMPSVASIEDADKQIANIEGLLRRGGVKSESGIADANKRLQFLREQRAKMAQQQVSSMAQPLQKIDEMQAQQQYQLQQNGQQVATAIEQKEAAQQEQAVAQSDKTDAILKNLNMFKSEMLKKMDEPAAVPIPIPISSQAKNDAMMSSL